MICTGVASLGTKTSLRLQCQFQRVPPMETCFGQDHVTFAFSRCFGKWKSASKTTRQCPSQSYSFLILTPSTSLECTGSLCFSISVNSLSNALLLAQAQINKEHWLKLLYWIWILFIRVSPFEQVSGITVHVYWFSKKGRLRNYSNSCRFRGGARVRKHSLQ